MARRAGNSGQLQLAGVTKLGVTNIRWNPQRDLPDATGMDSGGMKQAVDGNAGATFTCTAFLDNTGGAGHPPSIRTGGTVAFILDLDSGPTRRYSGNCRYSATPSTVDVNGTVTYEINATVEGDWTEA